MVQQNRTREQIREHYEIEKQLAERLRNSTPQERRTLYTSLYNELFRRVPHHPQIVRSLSPQASKIKVAQEKPDLQPFLKRDSTFLDIGAGDCALSLEVAKSVKKVYAIDVSNEITKHITPPSNFELILSDGSNIPVKESSVDIAYSNQLMEHLHPDDALSQLQNIYKALAVGGIYICVTPNRFNGPHDISKYFDHIATGFHLQEYTITELNHLFSATGFSKIRVYIRIKGIRLFLPPFIGMVCEKLLDILPILLRKRVSSYWPVAKLLGIRLIGMKKG